MIEVGILCVGDQPEGLAAVRALLKPDGFHEAVSETIVPDMPQIRRALRVWADARGVELVLTVGATGMGPRDHVPEATSELLERQVPGLAELVRLAGIQENRRAALSRGVAGVRGRTLIVNLPADDLALGLEAILPVLPAAVEALRGARAP